MILFTAGTTGRSKPALLTQGQLAASADAWAARLDPRPTDRWLACLPLFHVAGLAIVVRGGRWGVPVEVHRRFEADAVADAIEAGVSHVSLVAPMLEALLERGLRPVPATLRAVLLGGGPVTPELLGRARSAGLPIVPTYGMTETGSGVAAGSPPAGSPPADDPMMSDATALWPLPGVELRTRADTAEILVRGPMIFAGYLAPDGSLGGRDGDGWFATGDAGTIDARGALHVLDRRLDLIVSGGENVYPAEVEAVLTAHPAVAEAAVVGRADARWGAVPVAVVVIRPGYETTDDELLEHCRARLAGYKVPVALERRASLPRNEAGKVRRERLRAELGAAVA